MQVRFSRFAPLWILAVKFKDKKNREWVFSLSVRLLRNVKREIGVDLLSAVSDAGLMTRLFREDLFLVDVLEAVLGPQIASKKIKDFDEFLDGKVIQAAREALLEALEDFSSETNAAGLKAAFGRFQAAVAEAIQTLETDGGSSTSAPDASESSPGNGPTTS